MSRFISTRFALDAPGLGREHEAVLRVRDVSCPGCAQRAVEAFEHIDGVITAVVSARRGEAWVRFDARRTSARAIAAEMGRAGHPTEPDTGSVGPVGVVRLGLCAMAFANLTALSVAAGPQPIARNVAFVKLALAALVLAVGAGPLLRDASRGSSSHAGRIAFACATMCFVLGAIELCVATRGAPAPQALLAALGVHASAWVRAGARGFEGCGAIVVATLASWSAAAGLRRLALRDLLARDRARAAPARLLDRGIERAVHRDALEAGDRVRVLQGERAPADMVLDAPATVIERTARGGWAPVEKEAGASVAADSVFLSEHATASVTSSAPDVAAALDAEVRFTLERIDRDAASLDSLSWSGTAARALTVASFGVAALALAVHTWVGGGIGGPLALTSAIAVLASASAASLVLAAPAARALAVLAARADGVVVKDVRALEALATVDVACGFDLRDPLGPAAPAALRALWERGIGCRLLSGDCNEAAAAEARHLGIGGTGELSAAEKLLAVRDMQLAGARVLLVCDDLAAAARADVTAVIACGALPGAVAAPIVVCEGDVDRLAPLVDLARALRGRLRENVVIAATYNAVVLPAAALGLLTPLQGAALAAGEAVLVLANAARLLRWG